jgi:hypothetical protein
MSTSITNRSPTIRSSARHWVTRERVAQYSAIVLAIDLGYLTIRILGAYVFHLPNFVAPGWDFSVFWSASYLTLHQGAASAYDVSLIEQLVGPLQNLMQRTVPTPWVYPPTFLLAVRPLALLPFYTAYCAFLTLGVAFSGFMCARILKPSPSVWLPALAFPALWIALLSGQNSLFTLGLAAASLTLLNTRPWVAGVCIGLLAIKPQLGIAFPIALLFGREWRALTAAAVTAVAFCVTAGVLLGFDTFSRFLAVLPQFGQLTADLAGHWPNGGMPTFFAIARHIGLRPTTAYLVQAAVAVAALALVAHLFVIRSRHELRVAAVAAATLLSQPYMLGYDLVWLVLPIAFLIVDGRRHGWLKGDIEVLVVTWLAPLGFFAASMNLGLGVPPVIAAVMVIIFRRSRMTDLRALPPARPAPLNAQADRRQPTSQC